MPTYEYRCRACGDTVDRMFEHEDEESQRANRAEIKLVVTQQDAGHWLLYAEGLEAVVRKLKPLLPGPRGREVAFTADEMETLRQVKP